MGCDGIFDRMTNLDVQEQAWKTIEEYKTKYVKEATPGGMTVHQICGKVVDSLMQNAAIEKSLDNLTIVMVAFKGLQDYLSRQRDISLEKTEGHIKIQEGGDTSVTLGGKEISSPGGR